MHPAYAFIGAKRSFESGPHARPVLLGMGGPEAVFRQGGAEMQWRFFADATPEALIVACRKEMLGTDDVVVVPAMTPRAAAVCTAFGVSWCDSYGRLDVKVSSSPNTAVHRVWFDTGAPPQATAFDDAVARRVLGVLAARRRRWHSCGQLAEMTGASARDVRVALNGLDAVGVVRRRKADWRVGGGSTPWIVLELLAMSDDPKHVVDPAVSRRMRRVKSRDTRPEMVLRRALHSRGIRYRTHVSDLPGTPDLANKSAGWAVFVNGCFWHAHDCGDFVEPKTNVEFWREKFAAQKQRDQEVQDELRDMGYEVHVAWECEICDDVEGVAKRLARELR